MNSTIELKNPISEETLRKRDYRRRLKESQLSNKPLQRKITNKEEFKSGKLQKHKINYEGILNILTLHEGDKIETIKLYIDRIDRLYRNLFNVLLTPTNLNLLDRTEEITLFLEDKYNTFKLENKKPIKSDKDRGTLETLRSYINGILTILDRMDNMTTKTKYIQISQELNELYREKVKGNEPTIHERNNWISWKILNKMIEKSLISTLLTPQEKLISILYTQLISPRRIMDYQFMKIKKYNSRHSTPKYILNECERDKNFNYIIVNSTGLIREVIFNVYKTKDEYGQIKIIKEPTNNKKHFQLDNDFIKIMKPYLLCKNDGDFLLINPQTNEPFTQDKLSLFVSHTFKKITNKDMNCNLLRKIFITDNVINNPTLSTEIKEHMGVFMGHSIQTQGSYNRVMDKSMYFNEIRKYQFGLGEN